MTCLDSIILLSIEWTDQRQNYKETKLSKKVQEKILQRLGNGREKQVEGNNGKIKPLRENMEKILWN